METEYSILRPPPRSLPMTRHSELIAIDVEDLMFLRDGTGRLLIRRSKTDQAGEGRAAYLFRQTVLYLKAWIKAAHIKQGAVFRRIIGRGVVTYDAKGRGRIGEGEAPMPLHGSSKQSPSGSKYPTRILNKSVGTRCVSGNAGSALAECSVGDARRAMDDGAYADAVWGKCDGGARWHRQGSEGAGERL